MDFTISLAHFCEVHGPTSIICTQASSPTCGTCHPCVTPPSEGLPPDPYSSYNGLYDQPTALKLNGRLPQLSSPLETPPTSPRSPTHNPYFPSFTSSESGFASRRASSTFEPDSDVCENCQFIVPKGVSDRLPNGAPGSPSKDGRGRNGSPVLRTSKEFPVRGPTSRDEYSSSPDSSDMSDTEPSKSFESSPNSSPDSIPTSPMFVSPAMHTHKLNCIRTLSCEALPSGKASGPILFGDPVAGYTIAYIFRLQDPRARGHTRTYALIAMAGRDCRRATRAMVRVTEVFESLANKMVALTQKVLERESSASPLNPTQSRPSTATPGTPPLGSSVSLMPAFTSPQKDKTLSSVSSSPSARNITPVSSFLSAKRLDPDGYPRVSSEVMRAKSLIEIVGMEGFFVELHSTFTKLLHNLIIEFGT